MRNRWKRFLDSWGLTRVVGAISLFLGLLGSIDGGITYPKFFSANLIAFHQAMGPNLVSIGLTVLLIDWANEIRTTRLLKADLILQMGSPDNAFAIEAVRLLKARGWLRDGTLRRANLFRANLCGARMLRVDLQGANLFEANLQDARLWEANLQRADMRGANVHGIDLNSANLKDATIAEFQLVQAKVLWHAIMPNGDRYDGRYNLAGDLELASIGEPHLQILKTNINSPTAMADFYGISPEIYLKGQQSWTQQNTKKTWLKRLLGFLSSR